MSPEGLAALVGLVMPIVISLLKRPGWSDVAKLAVAGVVSLGVGAVSAWASGEVDFGANPERIFTSAAAAFTAATAVYKAWFAGTEWNRALTGWP